MKMQFKVSGKVASLIEEELLRVTTQHSNIMSGIESRMVRIHNKTKKLERLLASCSMFANDRADAAEILAEIEEEFQELFYS